jgi:Na+/proline symporter
MDIYSGAVLFSLIIYIAVGNYAGRRVKKLDDYFVAGRRAPVTSTWWFARPVLRPFSLS